MLGLKNLSIAGRGGSSAWWDKMWSSYTQLNPGVYSEAIATEFKRRMKPDYVDSAGTGYYYNTFGPSGLNKTTADWIGIMVTSSNMVSGNNTKTGSVIKWNCDGTIFTQNNTPAYNKGINAGIVTFTATDTFVGVTQLTVTTCNLTHLSGLYSTTNLVTLYVNGNPFTYFKTYEWTKLQSLVANNNGNLLTIDTYQWPLLTTFSIQNSKISTIVNTGTNNMSSDSEYNMYYPTAIVNSRLAYYNAMFAATPPIKNLTLNLSGATMGIPTGAGSNPDYLGIIAKVQAAGFIPTISTRTS